MSTSELTSAIGFFLTLTGLLSTFFYVHLSNWFREILELQSKYDENKVGDDDRRRNARIECKYQLKRLYNHVPLLVSVVITIFISAMATMASGMIGQVTPKPLIFQYYETAFTLFIFAYDILTLYFLIHGYFIAHRLSKVINPKSQPAV
ncbi:MAG: hypothetical protein GYA15_15645 [Leptolinea sp.]|jgi:hypothetical protein|nr:hypothetical protein [Leptolinea sp.]